MKQDILICGVGGQGILSMAFVLDQSSVTAGFFFKQTEVHGMAQRGGAVQAQLRISDQPVASGLIRAGGADLMLSLEPMEALRYLDYVSSRSLLVADITPHINIANYPDGNKLYEVLFSLPEILAVDGRYLARKAGVTRAQNMVVLGAATHSLPFSPELIEQGIGLLFASKEPRILQGNLSAFHRGRSAGQFYALMRNLGIASASISRILSRLDFDQFPIPDEIITAWQDFFSNSQAEKLAASVFEANVVLPMKVEIPYRLLEGLAPQILASAAT